jgi:SAM-dependent methyltransferase
LKPKFEAAGFLSPDDFFLKKIRSELHEKRRTLSVLSIGCGRCELELWLAEQLRGELGPLVTFVCMDLNGRMLAEAAARSKANMISDSFEFIKADLNAYDVSRTFDVVVANQCLHHVVEIGALLKNIRRCLAPEGVFLVSDIIGRNGHQLWPEALHEVEKIWASLPKKYKIDKTLGGYSDKFVNYDHSDVGFEGIHAQEILPLLIDLFVFELIIPYGCIILPFVERRFGWNFDPDLDEDKTIIDEIAQRDEHLIQAGVVKPTQLVASLSIAKRNGRRTIDSEMVTSFVRRV